MRIVRNLIVGFIQQKIWLACT